MYDYINVNSDIITLEKNNNIIVPKVIDPSYQTIINREGKVKVGESDIIVSENTFSEYKEGILINEMEINSFSYNTSNVKDGDWFTPYCRAYDVAINANLVSLYFTMSTYFYAHPEANNTQYHFEQKVKYLANAYANNNGILTPVQLKFKVWDMYGNVQAYFLEGNGVPVLYNVDFTIKENALPVVGYSISDFVEIGGAGTYHTIPSNTKLQFNRVNGKAGTTGTAFTAVAEIALTR